MFDVGRIVALAWALRTALRSRAWLPVAVLALAGYVFALELWSGFTVREQGPLVPMLALLLVFLGPSAMPRGPLPAVPLAGLVVAWPGVARLLACAAFAAVAARVLAGARSMPAHSEQLARAHAVFRSLLLCAVIDAMSLVEHVLPVLLGGDLSDGRVDE
jgi:hypothetical protein